MIDRYMIYPEKSYENSHVPKLATMLRCPLVASLLEIRSSGSSQLGLFTPRGHVSCVFFVVWGLYTGSVPTRVPTPGLPSQANAYARGSLC